MDISGQLIILLATLIDASDLLQAVCSKRSLKSQNRFIIKQLHGRPESLMDWQTRFVSLFESNRNQESVHFNDTENKLALKITCPKNLN